MNLYKLARHLHSFIEECQEEAKNFPEIGGHIDALDQFSEYYEGGPYNDTLHNQSFDFLTHTNYRIDIFRDEFGKICYAAYSPQAQATDSKIKNSHSDLVKCLYESGRSISYKERWCGFYSLVTGNGDDMFLILYGMSSDYPHNDYSEDVVREFAELIMQRPWPPKKVIIINNDDVKCYTQKDFDLPF